MSDASRARNERGTERRAERTKGSPWAFGSLGSATPSIRFQLTHGELLVGGWPLVADVRIGPDRHQKLNYLHITEAPTIHGKRHRMDRRWSGWVVFVKGDVWEAHQLGVRPGKRKRASARCAVHPVRLQLTHAAKPSGLPPKYRWMLEYRKSPDA